MLFVEVLLALTAGWLVFVLWRAASLFYDRRADSGRRMCKLVVFMSDQEDAAEGFLRKLAAWRNRLWPRLEVAVVDCGSADDTGRIIRLLAGEMDYPVMDKGFCGQKKGPGAGSTEAPVHYYDARGRKGRSLLNAPLFCYLKEAFN